MIFSFFQKSVFLSLVCAFLLFAPKVNASVDNAIFAGGCFWCLEHDLEELNGILSVESGYIGGEIQKPTYANHKGHKEAVQVTFDSQKISYKKLLRSYWRNIDPFDSKGQFCDRGDSYRPVIYFLSESQEHDAKESLYQASKELSVSKEEIGVNLQPAGIFWLAEDYHQDFAKKNPIKYNFYRSSCRRDKRLKEVWIENAKKGIGWN